MRRCGLPDPHRQRPAPVGFPVVGMRLCRALLHAVPVAGFRGSGAGGGAARFPGAGARGRGGARGIDKGRLMRMPAATNARGLLQFLIGILFLAAVMLALYAGWLEPSSLRLSAYSVSQASPQLKGLRIAVISDLHGGSLYIDAAKIERVVAMTNAAKPDLVLLTGDYMITGVAGGRYMPIEAMAARLKRLRAPLGVYAVLGNHDNWDDPGHIAAVLRQAGIPVLENRHRMLPSPRQDVAL